MPWWAHSRKATLLRVYAVKGVDPFCLGELPARFCVYRGKTGVKGGEGVEF
jgi:hypothetical protein